jgi:hypothetical protein
MDNVRKVIEEMAGDFLVDAIRVEEVFGEDKVRFTGCTPVRNAISDEEDGIIFLPMHLDKLLFTSSTEAAFLVEVGERNPPAIFFVKISMVSVERDFGKMMNSKKLLDVEIKAIADDFDVDMSFPTILVEGMEMGVDARMLLNKIENLFLIPLKNFYNPRVGFFRSDLSRPEIMIDALPTL